jgi:hypothetical protein
MCSRVLLNKKSHLIKHKALSISHGVAYNPRVSNLWGFFSSLNFVNTAQRPEIGADHIDRTDVVSILP